MHLFLFVRARSIHSLYAVSKIKVRLHPASQISQNFVKIVAKKITTLLGRNVGRNVTKKVTTSRLFLAKQLTFDQKMLSSVFTQRYVATLDPLHPTQHSRRCLKMESITLSESNHENKCGRSYSYSLRIATVPDNFVREGNMETTGLSRCRRLKSGFKVARVARFGRMERPLYN